MPDPMAKASRLVLATSPDLDLAAILAMCPNLLRRHIDRRRERPEMSSLDQLPNGRERIDVNTRRDTLSLRCLRAPCSTRRYPLPRLPHKLLCIIHSNIINDSVL